MLNELQTDRQNFSKIGKYISNKLHHVPKPKVQKAQEAQRRSLKRIRTIKISEHDEESNKVEKKNQIQKKEPSVCPPVGTYKVNYSIIDKNPRNCNFSSSTPHFYRQHYHTHQSTNYHKQYPDGFLQRQKGFAELSRMTGREQIKGNIRSQGEDPHENRFRLKHVTSCSTGLSFAKMSPRKDIIEGTAEPLPSYDYNYLINKQRLDSHIIGFEKQTNRSEVFMKQIVLSEDYRTGSEVPSLIDKTVEWKKQSPREGSGQLPSYMETVYSRMAVSLLNSKAMKMNSSEMKEGNKIQRRTKLTQSSNKQNSNSEEAN